MRKLVKRNPVAILTGRRRSRLSLGFPCVPSEGRKRSPTPLTHDRLHVFHFVLAAHDIANLIMQFVLTLLLQLAASLLLAPRIIALAPLGRGYHVVYAVLLGVLVWLAGLVVARVLKAMHGPRAATLAASIIGALVGVGVVLLPTVMPNTEMRSI